MSRGSMDVTNASRAHDLLTLARLSVGQDSVRTILDWLGQRTGATVLLVGAEGRVLAGPSGPAQAEPDVLRAVSVAVPGVHERGLGAAVLDTESGGVIHVLSLDEAVRDRPAAPRTGPPIQRAPTIRIEERAPYLVVVTGPDRQHGDLFADAARTLSLCWRLAEAERTRHRYATADAHGREAVLHLLMVGEVPPARRIASVLRPHLPDSLRVCVIECAGRERYQVGAEIERSLSGRAWIVPCPVRSNHLIALAPSDRPGDDAGPVSSADRLGQRITSRVRGCRIGVSEQVALHDTATGYEQAVHALAVARAAPEAYARFDRQGDLAPLIGPDGYAWADELLRPCLSYTPPRRVDPGTPELLATLTSWLTFDTGASRHLKIHRNTLTGRLRLLNSLLGLDLHRVRDQSAAWLALRLRAANSRTSSTRPERASPERAGSERASPERAGAGRTGPEGAGREAGDAPSNGDTGVPERLLGTPAVTTWARTRLRPLERADRPALTETVRTWLDADANLAATSAALGISLPATRKRLGRAEQALGRSLLVAPSVRHELWLAMRALGMVRP